MEVVILISSCSETTLGAEMWQGDGEAEKKLKWPMWKSWWPIVFPGTSCPLPWEQVSLVTRAPSMSSWRILETSGRGRAPKGVSWCHREGSHGWEPAHTRGCQVGGDFVWMGNSFAFTPQQRWYLASTTSNQFQRSRFMAENWFTVLIPLWRPNLTGLGRCLCHRGAQLRNDSFSFNWNDSRFFHRLISNYPCLHPFIKMITTAQIIFGPVLLGFGFYVCF